MPLFNYGKAEVTCKLVYYGPGRSGKTTNLQTIHALSPPAARGPLTGVNTTGDQTLYFDFLPLDLGEIGGVRTRFQLYTVPGQSYYQATRKLVLRGADGIVFVADSTPGREADNAESFDDLVANLAGHGMSLPDTPTVLQFNKRDAEGAQSIDAMNRSLNRLALPWFEAVACRGEGVLETMRAIAKLVIRRYEPAATPPGGST